MAASGLAAGPHQPNWLGPLTDSFRGHLRPLGSGPRSQHRSNQRPGFLQKRARHLQAWRARSSDYQHFRRYLPRLLEKQSGLDASLSLWSPFRPMAGKPTSSTSPPSANKTQQRLLRPPTYLMLPDADVRQPQHSLYSRWPLAGSGNVARTSARVRRSTRCVRARARCSSFCGSGTCPEVSRMHTRKLTASQNSPQFVTGHKLRKGLYPHSRFQCVHSHEASSLSLETPTATTCLLVYSALGQGLPTAPPTLVPWRCCQGLEPKGAAYER